MHSEYRKTRSPYGFPFLDPSATEELFSIHGEIKKILEKEGFRGVIPPTLDFPETFQEYESFDAFHMRDSLGEDLYLRNDVTAQIIKGFTNYLEHSTDSKKEYKFYYMLPVFRDARKSYPKLREVYQMGIETLGIDSSVSIPQLIKMASHIVEKILRKNLTITVGDIRVFKFLSGMFDTRDLKPMILSRDVPSLSDTFQDEGWSRASSDRFWDLLLYAHDYEKWHEQWTYLKSSLNNKIQETLMENIGRLVLSGVQLTDSLKKGNINVQWEPLVVRSVDYYTGYIFEGFVEGQSFAPLRGGTYDNLVGKYSSQDMTASGFALDLTSFLI